MTTDKNQQVEIFPWNNNFETGIEEIDRQHKQLIRLLNVLVGHLAYQSDVPAIEAVFDELQAYALTHFQSEEAIWCRYFKGDPWVSWHQDAHENFVTQLQEMYANNGGKPHEQLIEEIVTFLTHWLAMHIIESDKRMAKVVKALPSGISLEQAKDLANQEMSGATRLLIETVMGMYDKLASRTVSLTREISRRVKVEAELQAAQAELVRLRDEAMAASRAKSEFLTNMSHELRSPLHTLLGFSGLLLREAESGGDPLSLPQKESLETVRRSGEHLLTVINNILELSRIEAGDIPVETNDFHLAELVQELEQMFALEAHNRGLRLSCHCPPTVAGWYQGDDVKLRQVLINLLSNAIKFTDQGEVQLTVAPGAHGLCFSVIDTGPGLSAEEHAQLFQPFVQTATGRRSREGSGLGLVISKQFISLLGGTIAVACEPGQGCRFTFEIPLPPQPEPRMACKGEFRHLTIARDIATPVHRILVVDDNEGSRQLICRLLSPMGFAVKEAMDGHQALTLCQQWMPDLVFMDIHLPGMDGAITTQRLRCTDGGQQAKVIALTTSSFDDERASMLASGCDDFMRKPFRDSELLEMLARHLGLRLTGAG